jgi:hypothetical protein
MQFEQLVVAKSLAEQILLAHENPLGVLGLGTDLQAGLGNRKYDLRIRTDGNRRVASFIPQAEWRPVWIK